MYPTFSFSRASLENLMDRCKYSVVLVCLLSRHQRCAIFQTDRDRPLNVETIFSLVTSKLNCVVIDKAFLCMTYYRSVITLVLSFVVSFLSVDLFRPSFFIIVALCRAIDQLNDLKRETHFLLSPFVLIDSHAFE